jgi:hypothetical protein
MSRPAVLNMTKPPSHITTRTIASIRYMGTLLSLYKEISRRSRGLLLNERERHGIALLGYATIPTLKLR